MSMNRMRNIAVRMRPIAQQPAADNASSADEPGSAAAARPNRRPLGDDVSLSSKRQIWDVEADDLPPVSELEPRRPTPPERAEPLHALLLSNPTIAGDPASGRAKTRMLGFHTQGMDAASFEDEAAANKGPQFPAGFLVVIEGPGRGAFFAVTTRVSSIGRSPDQDVSLDFGDESISREGHASVVYDGEQNRFYLGHGNKANVVRRNGVPVLTTEELAHNDTIRIGKTSLRFHAFCGDDFTWTDSDVADEAGRPHD